MVNPFKSGPRERRLQRDLGEMLKLRAESTILDFTMKGDPPESYVLTFAGRGLHPDGGFTELHQVAIQMGAEYPREKPAITWQTLILHPNISGSNVCMGSFTMSPYVKLTELVEILWDMARMAVYNIHSAYQKEVPWIELMKSVGGFPVDPRILRDRVGRPPAPPGSDEPEIFIMGASEKPKEGPSAEAIKANVEFYLARNKLSHDSHVYTQEEWVKRGEKYGNDAQVTIATEGPLYALLNQGDWPGATFEIERFNGFLAQLGLYWDLGYAWSVHLYPLEGA